jgi:hypothetical protein
MQSLESEQEILVTSTALAGGLWSDHVEPLFEVVMTYGVELRLVPTAMQVVSLVQSMEFGCVPNGIEVVICQAEKSVVVSEVAPPPEAIPMATQFVDVAQARESRALIDGT